VDVERGLPLRIETKVVCHLSEMQRLWYERLLLKDADIMDLLKTPEEGGLSEEQQRKKKLTNDQNRVLQSLVVQLRKACAHP
jgi:SNF2 family DNA or RNA helicase